MSLGGFDAPPRTDRLFFAVYPDPEALRCIVGLAEAVRAQHHLRGNPLRADRMHVTLHHLGDYAGVPDSLLADAHAAAAGLATAPFEVAFDCVASFPGRGPKRPCVLRGEGEGVNAPLRAFQSVLGERLRAAGMGRFVERRFTPHVTLLYDQRSVSMQAVPAVEWTVREFALVHSLIGRSEHRVLARWPLRDWRAWADDVRPKTRPDQ